MTGFDPIINFCIFSTFEVMKRSTVLLNTMTAHQFLQDEAASLAEFINNEIFRQGIAVTIFGEWFNLDEEMGDPSEINTDSSRIRSQKWVLESAIKQMGASHARVARLEFGAGEKCGVGRTEDMRIVEKKDADYIRVAVDFVLKMR